jgi:hypothetical protein
MRLFERLSQKVRLETDKLLVDNKISDNRIVSEDDIKSLPVPVWKWLDKTGVVGKPYIHVGKVSQKAEMKMKPDQKNWMKATALQYSTIDTPAFIWTVKVKMNSLLNFWGRDKFENGKGEMLIKVNSIFKVVDSKGEKIDEGALQRYLGELIWFPTLALSKYISWEQIDDLSAKATMKYKGTEGSGVFYFNTEGDFTKFVALRFKDNVEDAKRYEWIMSVEDYKLFEGLRIPAKGVATWRLEEGDWTWLKLEITDIKYN